MKCYKQRRKRRKDEERMGGKYDEKPGGNMKRTEKHKEIKRERVVKRYNVIKLFHQQKEVQGYIHMKTDEERTECVRKSNDK